MEDLYNCKECNGTGVSTYMCDTYASSGDEDCQFCDGTGSTKNLNEQ